MLITRSGKVARGGLFMLLTEVSSEAAAAAAKPSFCGIFRIASVTVSISSFVLFGDTIRTI